MMGKSVFFSEGTAGQMKSAPSFAKDDDSTLPKEPNGSKIGLGPKPIWGMSAHMLLGPRDDQVELPANALGTAFEPPNCDWSTSRILSPISTPKSLPIFRIS